MLRLAVFSPTRVNLLKMTEDFIERNIDLSQTQKVMALALYE